MTTTPALTGAPPAQVSQLHQLYQTRIAVLGCGSLGESIVAGLLACGVLPAQISVSSRRAERRAELLQHYGVSAGADNRVLAAAAELLVLAAKPAQMPALCAELAGLDCTGKLLISVAAGLTTAQFAGWLQTTPALVRAMPNTPAAVQKAATGLYANALVSPAQRELAEALFSAIGAWVWLEREDQMDWVTALAGSGPAYFYQLMADMVASAVKAGFPEAPARLLVKQTALGAALLASADDAPELAELIRRVRSPGGTTEKALNTLAEHDFAGIIDRMLTAAEAHGRTLAALSQTSAATPPSLKPLTP